MKLQLNKLGLIFHRSIEVIDLSHVTYFYGRIGAGKSSIVRLIDYCLGAHMEWTPALQQEFVSATLEIQIGDVEVSLKRDKNSNIVVASWRDGNEFLQIAIPARIAAGEVLPGVAVLSDLLFFFVKIDPPKVRRRRGTPDEKLERLSFRDLFRFCYLDQDGMDNDFFLLNSDNSAARQKSIDALRFLLGYHQEKVASLENEIQNIHEELIGIRNGTEALIKALIESGFDDIQTIDAKIDQIRTALEKAKTAAALARSQRTPMPHVVDELRQKARAHSQELIELDQVVIDIDARLNDLERHHNELEMLSVRYQRTASARAILGGVDFRSCPRCTQLLPTRESQFCVVCGQPENMIQADGALSEDVIKHDLKSRQNELVETMDRMKEQKRRILNELTELHQEKNRVDLSLNDQLQQYDSAFLSQAIEHTRAIAGFNEKLNTLLHYRKLQDVIKNQRKRSDELKLKETGLRRELESARKKAFQDTNNLKRLSELFLDCLLRVKFPNVKPSFYVKIDQKTFVPEVSPSEEQDFAVLSFANMGSGGMKSLFKACYGLALHRLCTQIGSSLPTVLMLDMATKNVSSQEDPEVFQAFYRLVYELAINELYGTQFVLVENEYWPVPEGINIEITKRHLVPGDADNPPLIPYFVPGEELHGEAVETNEDENSINKK